jgi:AcrR family transcriptional regulator
VPQKRGPKTAGKSKSWTPLTRERLVETALGLIDKEGLDAFSTRKLGTALGVEAMSIYNHFQSKGELLDAIASRLLAEVELPERGQFRARLSTLLRSYRAVAQRHPDAFPLLALRRLNTKEAFRFLEYLFALFAAEGFGPPMQARLFRLVGHWAVGAALSELAVHSRVPHSTPAVEAEQMDPALYPLTTRATPYLMPAHFDASFEFGLDRIIAVIEDLPR